MSKFVSGLLVCTVFLPLLAACQTTTASHSSLPNPTATVLSSANNKGVTITLQSMTATALATKMKLTITAPQGQAYSVDFDHVFLAAKAHGYAPQGAISVSNNTLSLEFPAFADEDLGHPLLGALTILSLTIFGTFDTLDGPWRIPFQLTPLQPRTLAPSSSPIAHHGLGLQLTRVDWVTGNPGGVRVRLQVVQTPTMTMVSPSQFSAEILNASLDNFALLVLSDQRNLKPQAVVYRIDTVTTQGNQDFLREGIFQGTLDFIYIIAPLASGVQAHLHLERIPTQSTTDFHSGTITGPWDFDVPA